MNISLQRWSMIACTGVLYVLLSGCVATGGGYGYDDGVGVGIGLDYYEPVGGYYGGWGHGYHVGPPRGNYDHHDYHHGSPHQYRSAPASHRAPSIPNRARSSSHSRSH